ncbi:ABC transporter substrate-binding protein [Vulcanisaeta souniana]|uniref:ABC transporter substrate-binding protein n=1 Tax=Vulcanisaeta souniana TaxID=164452 RepID=UPI001FB40FD0|nr:ABC transporter substrate-binding protein [Vulcanisaeta souniana]
MTRALDGVPHRIISLNPSINEFLFVMGIGDRVVGTDLWSYRPREAMKTFKVGSFTSADLEAIRRLRPDLIILSYPVQRQLVEPLSSTASVLAVPMPVNLNAVMSSFEMVGKLLDADEEAHRVMDTYMDLLRQSTDLRDALVVLSLGDYVIPCESSYIPRHSIELVLNTLGALSALN